MPLFGLLLWVTLLIMGWQPSHSKDFLFAAPRVQLSFKGKAQHLCVQSQLRYNEGLVWSPLYIAVNSLLKCLYLECLRGGLEVLF